MTSLKVSVESENSLAGKSKYRNKVNADNFKEIALVFKDLKNLGVPVEKAIKQMRSEESDWDISLGL